MTGILFSNLVCRVRDNVQCVIMRLKNKVSVRRVAAANITRVCGCCRVNVLYLHVSAPPLGPISMIQQQATCHCHCN